ncbi:MAG TPA: TIGR03790 family protein, partial [Massilia sp.]|nr:TIGR03790 family protein [Massilia sp.]
ESVAAAKALVDRGVTSGFRPVPASAYYLTTSETTRNSRAAFFPPAGRIAAKQLEIKRLQAEALDQVDDIMVYQLGKASV